MGSGSDICSKKGSVYVRPVNFAIYVEEVQLLDIPAINSYSVVLSGLSSGQEVLGSQICLHSWKQI